MQYILLINVPAEAAADPEMTSRHAAFAEAAGRRGQLVGGAQLADPPVTTTLRRAHDQTIVSDGPHTETKEFLGGYYIVECADLDEAIAVASEVPLSEGGSLEIRPIVA